MARSYALLRCVLGAVVLLEGVLAQTEYCPAPEDIAPCTCSPPELSQTKPTLKCGSEVPSNENFTAVLQASYPTYDFYQLFLLYNDDVTDVNVLTNLTFEMFVIDSVPISKIEPWLLLQFAETLTYISVTYTNITDDGFPFDTIPDLPVLRDLDVSHNPGITTVPEIISSSLIFLTFESCSVLSIPSGHLSGMPNYESFWALSNEITFLEAGAVPLNDATNHLELGGNPLGSIEPGAFYYTSLEEWEASDEMWLNLGGNQLQQLVAGSIPLPDGEVTVYLQFNEISYVEPGAFVFLENSVFTSFDLFMHNNSLTEISEDAFREVLEYATFANFYGNPLSCGCDFAWIALDFSIRRKIYRGTSCANGTLIFQLNFDEYLSC